MESTEITTALNAIPRDDEALSLRGSVADAATPIKL